jgi:hypothetical protein
VTLALVVALAVVTVGRAGSGPKEFNFFAQPTILSQDADGVAWGRFKPVSGGGSATHLVIYITIPTVFEYVPANTSTGCAPTSVAGTFSCAVGTVNPGQTVKRYVGFRAPAGLAAGDYPGFSGKATFDNGTPGAGGGGSDVLTDGPISVTVVTAPDGNRDGGCNGRPRTDDVPLSSGNPVSTEIRSGTRLGSLGLPCTWAFAGETSAPSGNSFTAVSFFGFPQTEPGAPVEQVMTVYDMPVPFKNLKVLFDLNFTGPADTFAGTALEACAGPGNTLGSQQAACLKSLVKMNKGAQAIILSKGTGADPGAGLG